jgi:hypothetical protein
VAITPARCSICKQQAYRNRHGQMLAHTRDEWQGLRKVPIVCEGSDKGARP